MKLLKWLDGISSGIRSYLSDMLWYDYRVYPIVFWAIVPRTVTPVPNASSILSQIMEQETTFF